MGLAALAATGGGVVSCAWAQTTPPQDAPPAQAPLTVPGHPEAQQRQGPDAPGRASPIQGGHRLQPRRDDLTAPDVSGENARKVDELYRKLMESERPAGGQKP